MTARHAFARRGHVRRGFALPAALAAVVVLAALAALANVAARTVMREAAAFSDEARSVLARASLRERMTIALAAHGAGELQNGGAPLGERDTILVARALAWPWHRIAVLAADTTILAEIAHARTSPTPWCAAAVSGGAIDAPSGTFSVDPPGACDAALLATTPDSAAAFGATLERELVLAAMPETLSLGGAPSSPAVWRAATTISVRPGAAVAGVLIAPVIRVEAGATVRGIVVARDSLVFANGASGIGDALAVQVAIAARARLTALGRRGLLLPP